MSVIEELELASLKTGKALAFYKDIEAKFGQNAASKLVSFMYLLMDDHPLTLSWRSFALELASDYLAPTEDRYRFKVVNVPSLVETFVVWDEVDFRWYEEC